MSGRLSEWFKACARQFAAPDRAGAGGRPLGAARCEDANALESAHRDWLAASRLFDSATEPELVDYAIYSLKAAEKHYVYLWKMARDRQRGE
jgi:hypothetical protein